MGRLQLIIHLQSASTLSTWEIKCNAVIRPEVLASHILQVLYGQSQGCWLDDKARNLVVFDVISHWDNCRSLAKLCWVTMNKVIETAYVQKK
jgi:hypothetical protein